MPKLYKKPLLASLLVMAGSLSGRQTSDNTISISQKDVDSIVTQFEEKYVDAYNRGDGKGLAALYTENATDMGELGSVLQGRTKIGNALAVVVPAVKSKIENKTLRSAAVTNEVIVVHGMLSRIAPAGTSAPPAKAWDAWSGTLYTQVLVREDGGWHLAAMQHALRPVMPKDPHR